MIVFEKRYDPFRSYTLRSENRDFFLLPGVPVRFSFKTGGDVVTIQFTGDETIAEVFDDLKAALPEKYSVMRDRFEIDVRSTSGFLVSVDRPYLPKTRTQILAEAKRKARGLKPASPTYAQRQARAEEKGVTLEEHSLFPLGSAFLKLDKFRAKDYMTITLYYHHSDEEETLYLEPVNVAPFPKSKRERLKVIRSWLKMFGHVEPSSGGSLDIFMMEKEATLSIRSYPAANQEESKVGAH